MDNRQTFTDHAQQARHAFKSATFILRIDELELRTHDANGELYALRSAPTLEGLRDGVQDVKAASGIASHVANDIVSAINDAIRKRETTEPDADEADIRIIDVSDGIIVATQHEIPEQYHEREIKTLTSQRRYDTRHEDLSQMNLDRKKQGKDRLTIATDF